MEMGLDMNGYTLKQAIKKVMRTMLDERDTLVHCKQGKHRTGSFVMFLYALWDDKVEVGEMIDDYIQLDAHIRPHDRGCILRVWRESDLWSLLDAARGDHEIQQLVADIHARLDKSNSHRVKGSRLGRVKKIITKFTQGVDGVKA